MHINRNNIIPYISIFLSVFFYYAEMARQFFFKIFSNGTNAIQIFEHTNMLSFYYFAYLIAITPLFIFNVKDKISVFHKYLFYFVFPYFLSIIAWFLHVYLNAPLNTYFGRGTELGIFGYITITIYIIYGSFLIPIIAVITNIIIYIFMKIKNKNPLT